MCDQDHFEKDQQEYEALGLVTRRQFGVMVGAGIAMMLPQVANAVTVTESDVNVMTPDGSADCYVADPGADNTPTCAGWNAAPGWSGPLQNWGNIVTVRLHVLARNVDQTSDWTDTRTYDMGLAGITAAANDHYKRHTYSAVLRVANVAGMREQ